jgi:hypothetical protein
MVIWRLPMNGPNCDPTVTCLYYGKPLCCQTASLWVKVHQPYTVYFDPQQWAQTLTRSGAFQLGRPGVT